MGGSSGDYYVLDRLVLDEAAVTVVKFDSSWNPMRATRLETVNQQIEFVIPVSNIMVKGEHVIFVGVGTSGNDGGEESIYLVNVSVASGVVEDVREIVLPQNMSPQMLPFYIFAFRSNIILKPYDGGFYIVTSLKNETSDKHYVMVAKVSDSLAIEWANAYETEAPTMHFDIEKVGDKLFITGYEGEDSAFIMGVEDRTGEPLFYKVFFVENHYSLASADIDYYGGKLHVYGAEEESIGDEESYDTFVAVFDLDGNLEDYITLGEDSLDDMLPFIFPGEIIVENGEYVLASVGFGGFALVAKIPWGF